MPIPATPTTVDMTKPVIVRSMRYQRTGFVRANVADAWVVDAHGVLRCDMGFSTDPK
jgi:hypothetical protein